MEKKGFYSLIASLATSLVVVLVFYVLASEKIQGGSLLYSSMDVYSGMVFVFILSMIVSASIWPGIIEKRMEHIHF